MTFVLARVLRILDGIPKLDLKTCEVQLGNYEYEAEFPYPKYFALL
jgi:hypothetical protein